jgi:hypothetical protein
MGELVDQGEFAPLYSPPGVNTIFCLEEWRGKQRISPPGDNFTPGGQLRPGGQSLPLGAKLIMGLRLGEFTHSGRLFTLGSFFKNYRSSANIWTPCTSYVLNLTKKWVRLRFVRFFRKAHLFTLVSSERKTFPCWKTPSK